MPATRRILVDTVNASYKAYISLYCRCQLQGVYQFILQMPATRHILVYTLDASYKAYISAEELQDTQESCQQFYIRNFFVTQCALQVTKVVLFFRFTVPHIRDLSIFALFSSQCVIISKMIQPYILLTNQKAPNSTVYFVL